MVSCAYLEGDRVISTAYRQQFSAQCQDGKTLFDLSTYFGSPSAVEEEQSGVSAATDEEMPSSRKTQFLQVAPDAGPFSRFR